MRAKGTKYEKIEVLPREAKAISVYADEMGIRNPAYISVKYDRFIAQRGTDPGYTIKCYQGINFVIPS